MLSVHLSDLTFHAYHGVHEGETKTGNDFLVHLTVTYDEKNIRFDNMVNVINYVELYEIVKKRMAIPSHLLEEVATTIILKIRHQYSMVQAITISIYKLQPPIEGFQGKVGITLEKRF